MTPPIWWLMMMGHDFYTLHMDPQLYSSTHWSQWVKGSELGAAWVKEFNSDQKFCLHGQSSVLCVLGLILKWNLASLCHFPLTCVRHSCFLFPGSLRDLAAAVFVQAEGDRGQEGARSQGSRSDLQSSILRSSHSLSGPCDVQVSFLEAFHSCSYLGLFRT